MCAAQVLTAEQMRGAEQAIFDTGVSQYELMERAAGGAAEWIRRVASGRSVTVLCGPGNNGGDGYVIARLMRGFGNAVQVVAPMPPKTQAAQQAREAWGVETQTSGNGSHAEVFVDCLFGTGLTRELSAEHALLLRDLAERHRLSVAVDLPSGVASDTGEVLNERLPSYDVTLALGAWKHAHWSLPARAGMGRMRLVRIGVDAIKGAAQLITRPKFDPPALDSHKYTRGLAAVIGGEIPGAAVLAAHSAQRAGAGYVKLLAKQAHPAASEGLVVDPSPVSDALADQRINAVLVGPGLGRGGTGKDALSAATRFASALVIDADACVLLAPNVLSRDIPILATPHDGELEAMCRSFSVIAEGRRDRAIALAKVTGAVICAKGPDTVIAAPDGRLALAPPAPNWLSVAGSGDVLAGIAVSRMACARDPYAAACEAVWLHGEAARQSLPPFTPDELALAVTSAYRACL